MTIPQNILSQIITGTPDETLVRDSLVAAGQYVFQQQAGYIPEICPEPPPEHCPPDEGAYCSEQILDYLRLINHKKIHPDLMPVWLQCFHSGYYRLPEEELPFALNRQSITGKRGIWLVKQKPDSELTSAIENWYRSHYAKYLDTIRRFDPTQGRNIIEKTINTNSPFIKRAHQRNILESLIVNLSLEDEPLIEKLADEIAQHRNLTHKLTAHLYDIPESQVHQFLNTRMAGILKYDSIKKQISLTKSLKLLKRIQVFPAHTEYINWHVTLFDALEIVPPHYWSQKWQLDGEMLLDMALVNPEMNHFIYHWFIAALRSSDANFVQAAFYHLINDISAKHIHAMSQLLSLKSYRQLIFYAANHSEKNHTLNPLYKLLRYYPGVMNSDTYSPAFLIYLEYQLQNGHESTIQSMFEIIRRHITPRHEAECRVLLEQFLEILHHEYEKTTANQIYDEHHQFFELRQQIHDAFNNP